MKNMKVLVVDAESKNRETIKKMLFEFNYSNVICCSNGFDAINISRLEKMDLIVMDLLPNEKLDGVETAKLISTNAPIIFISNTFSAEANEELNALKKVSFVMKPITQISLKNAIENALGLCK